MSFERRLGVRDFRGTECLDVRASFCLCNPLEADAVQCQLLTQPRRRGGGDDITTRRSDGLRFGDDDILEREMPDFGLLVVVARD